VVSLTTQDLVAQVTVSLSPLNISDPWIWKSGDLPHASALADAY